MYLIVLYFRDDSLLDFIVDLNYLAWTDIGRQGTCALEHMWLVITSLKLIDN